MSWAKYQRKGHSEMRPIVPGESLENISVSAADIKLFEADIEEFNKGMVARNPENHFDQWYVNRKYFEENLEFVEYIG